MALHLSDARQTHGVGLIAIAQHRWWVLHLLAENQSIGRGFGPAAVLLPLQLLRDLSTFYKRSLIYKAAGGTLS